MFPRGSGNETARPYAADPAIPNAIASAVPGRVRLRHPGLRRPECHRALIERVAALDGLRVADANAAVGSLLVLYDPAGLSPPAVEAAVAAAAAAVLGTSAPPGVAPAPPQRARRSSTWSANRVAKIGMLTSMTATLAALTVGRRLHAGAGVVFLAFMLVHIAQHRRRLFQ